MSGPKRGRYAPTRRRALSAEEQRFVEERRPALEALAQAKAALTSAWNAVQDAIATAGSTASMRAEAAGLRRRLEALETVFEQTLKRVTQSDAAVAVQRARPE